MDNDVECLFTGLFVICISSLGKCLYIFGPFSNWIICLLFNLINENTSLMFELAFLQFLLKTFFVIYIFLNHLIINYIGLLLSLHGFVFYSQLHCKNYTSAFYSILSMLP